VTTQGIAELINPTSGARSAVGLSGPIVPVAALVPILNIGLAIQIAD